MVIFLSNFLALLIRVRAAGEDNRAVLAAILVVVNVFLFLAVVAATWFSTQQTVDNLRDGTDVLAVASSVGMFKGLTADSTLTCDAARSRAGGRREIYVPVA